MHSTYTQKIQPLLNPIENFVKDTNSQELDSFFTILVNQIEEELSTPTTEIPIIFFGIPDSEEQAVLEQYLGPLSTTITALESTSIKLADSNLLPTILYHWKNISMPQWLKRPNTPGIIVIFKNGLSNKESTVQLSLLLKKLPLTKLIHTGISDTLLQQLEQETNLITTLLSSLKEATIRVDIQELSSEITINKMKQFKAIASIKSATIPLIMEKTKEIKIGMRIKKQQAKQRLDKLSKETIFTSSNKIDSKQLISSRLKKFETLLGEHLSTQFHPSDGQLITTIEQQLAQLDELQEKKEGKNTVYSLKSTFSDSINQQFKDFCQTECRDNLNLATVYLQIIQRELQDCLKEYSLNTHLAMPAYLVEDKVDRLIRDTAESSKNFSVSTPKKKFKDYFMAIREPFFLMFMVGSIVGMFGLTTNFDWSTYSKYSGPFLLCILGITIYNLWSKNLETKETVLLKGIKDGKEHIRNNLSKNAKDFTSKWKVLLTNRIKEITTQWQEQINTELKKKEVKEKERLASEKNRIQLIINQLSQQAASLNNAERLFMRTKLSCEKMINNTSVTLNKDLKRLFTTVSKKSLPTRSPITTRTGIATKDLLKKIRQPIVGD